MSRYGRDFRRGRKKEVHNEPSFFAPLTHNLLLSKGQGVATFTRATTKTIVDFEGLIKTIKSGEVGIEGARRVENLIPSAGTGSASLAVAAAKTMTLDAGDYVFSMGIGTGTATFSGTGGATGTLTANATNRTSILKTITAGTFIVTGSVATLIDLQVENVTGKANKNPSEYVSNGVPVGLIGSELVTNGTFDTNTTGWASSSSFYSTAVATNGEMIVTPTTAFGRQITSIPTVIGKTYTVSGYIRKVSGNTNYIYLALTTSVGSDITSFGHITATIPTLTTGSFVATATTSYICCCMFSILDVGAFDNVTVKETVYHGAGVDGVKYFTTQNGNTVSSNVVTEATGAAISEESILGVLVDKSAINKALNSPTFVTQNITVSAVQQTISFYGTGTLVLSGVGTGTLVGTGANILSQLIFTPTAGTLVCMVTGACTYGQLEDGAYATGRIITAGASVTRNADILSYQTLRNLYATSGTIFLSWTPKHAPVGTFALWGSYVDASNYTMLLAIDSVLTFRQRVAGVNYDSTIAFNYVSGTTYKIVITWSNSGKQVFVGGVSGVLNTSGLPLELGTTWQAGSDGNGLQQCGGNTKLVKINKSRLSDIKITESQKTYLTDESGNYITDENNNRIWSF